MGAARARHGHGMLCMNRPLLCKQAGISANRYTCNAVHTVDMAVTMSEHCVTNCRINSGYRRCELSFLWGGGRGLLIPSVLVLLEV